MSVTEPDYAHETRLALDARITRLEEAAREARREAENARRHPGLLGPAENAQAVVDGLRREAAELREIALRIDRGYPWWERSGFEIALEACALFTEWQPLAEKVTADYVFPHDEISVRLPIDVQSAYQRALDLRLFTRFEVCSTFETDGHEVESTTHYLFGLQPFPTLGDCLFLVESWGEPDSNSPTSV